MSALGPTDPTRPSYYVGSDGLDGTRVIYSFGLGYFTGCAVKYILRAGRKTPDAAADLRKAIRCLEIEVEHLEAKP